MIDRNKTNTMEGTQISRRKMLGYMFAVGAISLVGSVLPVPVRAAVNLTSGVDVSDDTYASYAEYRRPLIKMMPLHNTI